MKRMIKILKILKREIFGFFTIWALILFLLFSSHGLNLVRPRDPIIKEGQIWKREWLEANPFDAAIYDTLIILETRKDHSKVIRQHGIWSDTIILKNDYIIQIGELIK